MVKRLIFNSLVLSISCLLSIVVSPASAFEIVFEASIEGTIDKARFIASSAEEATSGFDLLDVPHPPALPTDYLDLFSKHARSEIAWSGQPLVFTDYQKNVQASPTGTDYVFVFYLRSDRTGSVDMSWSGVNDSELDNYTLVLRNLENDSTTNMRLSSQTVLDVTPGSFAFRLEMNAAQEPTETPTPEVTATPTTTSTLFPTSTATQTPVDTVTPTETVTTSPTSTNTASPSQTPTLSPTPTNAAPLVSLGAEPVEGEPPLEVDFVGSATDTDGLISHYAWFLSSPDVPDASESLSPPMATFLNETAFVYQEGGTYEALFQVRDDSGAVVSASRVISVWTPVPCDPVFDLSGDGSIGPSDLLLLMEYIRDSDLRADMNCDGIVDSNDLLRFSLEWQPPVE